MTPFKFFIFNISIFICFKLYGQQRDSVQVLPGKGIVFNNDSILLNKTTVKEVHKVLNIRDNQDPHEITLYESYGFDAETGETVYHHGNARDIIYKSITFEFRSETYKDNLKLKWIRIKDYHSLIVFTTNGLLLGTINPNINEFFPDYGKNNYISNDKLTYNLYAYGISFQLERLDNNRIKLNEISTHWKIE